MNGIIDVVISDVKNDNNIFNAWLMIIHINVVISDVKNDNDIYSSMVNGDSYSVVTNDA